MGTKPSKATEKAFEILKSGKAKTAVEAARKAGIHRDTLYGHEPYKQWKAQQQKGKK